MTDEQHGANTRGALLALLAMAIFATHDVIIKLLGESYSPFQIVFFSVLFSFPLTTVVLMHDTTDANLRPKHPWWVAIRTVCAVIVGFSAFYAFSNLPLAETYSILFIAPILITILSIPILGETVRLRRWAAIVVGLVGVVIVLQPGKSDLNLGHLAALAAAVFSALASVIVRKIGSDERSAVLMLYPMVANFVVMGAILPFVYKPVEIEHLGGFAAMAVLGVIAGMLIIAAYKRAEAVIVAPMQYSQILWASIFGLIFFDETLGWNVIVGAGVIILSGIYIVLRETKKSTSRTSPVLRSMHLGRDKGTSPRPGMLARFRGESS